MTAALSLSEVEAIALKAARGAGMTWGLAEEAAFAARWLVEQGVEGLTLLAAVLGQLPPEALGVPPVLHEGDWQSAAPRPMCPIASGAALNDHFALPGGPLTAPVRLHHLASPALALPLIAGAAARCDAVVIVQWSGCQVVLSQGALLAVIGANLLAERADLMTVTAGPALTPQRHAAAPSDATMQALEALVARTYVPASEQSRRGAGSTDSDTA